MIRSVVVFLRELISNPNREYAGCSFPGSSKRKPSLTSTFFLIFFYTCKLYLTQITTSISFCCSRVYFVFTRSLRHRAYVPHEPNPHPRGQTIVVASANDEVKILENGMGMFPALKRLQKRKTTLLPLAKTTAGSRREVRIEPERVVGDPVTGSCSLPVQRYHRSPEHREGDLWYHTCFWFCRRSSNNDKGIFFPPIL